MALVGPLLPRRVWLSPWIPHKVNLGGGGTRSGSAVVRRAGRDIMLKNRLQHGGDGSIQ